MGRDYGLGQPQSADGVSIHAPRVGRDIGDQETRQDVILFQSTRPVWGATDNFRKFVLQCVVSIHAPRVGRDGKCGRVCLHQNVSIHAPRVGRDASQEIPLTAR